ncbi:unnamed protein product [Kuraishia capsulata CBS 1993]|uniref:Peroxin-3 n=1 Tax=Kuraishia capsulata CBS 1993 TaxID=1382522 RepID=W6MRE3_9ASCO|nr:uncharacterized protein KUCA_T00005304001 [Kuraishia capsulata CBS 1993]CDK29316.1 unnamed protein product [Kuraishia capsulata CBS 1993]
MFESWTRFFRRNRRRLLISTGLLAILYVGSKYLTSKLVALQKRLTEENFAKEQIKRRFQQTQRDCYLTFLSLLPVLAEPILHELPVESITRQLQSKRLNRAGGGSANNNNQTNSSTILSDDFSLAPSDPTRQQTLVAPEQKSKTQLWSELKLQTITRFFTLAYSESLLIVFLHLQLNILSRRSYLETALKLASQNNGIQLIDNEISGGDESISEQAFLSFSWWLLNKGWLEIKKQVETCVEDVWGELNPRQELTMVEFASLIQRTQSLVESVVLAPGSSKPQRLESSISASYEVVHSNESESTMLKSLLPPEELEFFLLQQTNDLEFLTRFNSNVENTESLSNLLQELEGYLARPELTLVLSSLATTGIARTMDKIAVSLIPKADLSNESADADALLAADDIPKAKLAAYLAQITKQSISLTNNSVENEILLTMNNLQELNDISASVYSNFDE